MGPQAWAWAVPALALASAHVGFAQNWQPAQSQPANGGAPGVGVPGHPVQARFLPTPQQQLQQIQASWLAAVSDERVVAAMNAGTDYLLAEMQHLVTEKAEMRGSNLANRAVMATYDFRSEGAFAMGAYALLVMHKLTGDERLHFNSPQMKPIIEKLLAQKPTFTYSLATQASALSLLPNRPEFRKPLERCREGLYRGSQKGAYAYMAVPPAVESKQHNNVPLNIFQSACDNSNTQYGVLGMWAVDDGGLEVRNDYWQVCDTYWRRAQLQDGSWMYSQAYLNIPGINRQLLQGTSTMTAAGVASLYVTTEKLDRGVRQQPVADRALASGMEWMARDFEHMRMQVGANLYYAYGVERIGRASGMKYFGKFNWYREGAASILAHQQTPQLIREHREAVARLYPWQKFPDEVLENVNLRPGGWRDPWGGEVVGTAYALLFLARGRSPVVFNKLAYPGPWNARPRDVANLNRWLSKRTERLLNWQIVTVEADPDDWLDAPVLVITGHGDPKFTEEHIRKLRRFAQAGGLIFSTADGADRAFTEAIRRKYAPQIAFGQYEMRQLPLDHPIYTLDYKPTPGKEPVLYGLSNGVRDLWIHSPADMGAAWQTYANFQRREYWDLAANLYFYVSGRASLRSKLDSLAVAAPAKPPGKTLTLGRLEYKGNWNPEPEAWARMGRLAALHHGARLKVQRVEARELDARAMPLVHITGTAAITLPDGDLAALEKYLKDGGFLFIDSAGGSDAFTATMQRNLQRIIPQAKTEPVSANAHPVLTGQVPEGTAIKSLDLRRFCLQPERPRRPGVLEYKLGNRTVALLFEGDISSGLLGTSTWGIAGYTPKTSEALAWNVLQYATAGK